MSGVSSEIINVHEDWECLQTGTEIDKDGLEPSLKAHADRLIFHRACASACVCLKQSD